MAKTIFAGGSGKTGKNRGKIQQKLSKSKTPQLMTVFIIDILQAVSDPYCNSGTDSEHE